MSTTIADTPYAPEEHAPDPVFGHGDPTSPGKIGIWLFLASEIMFFIGILGSYIILRSGSPEVFEAHARSLSKPLAALNTLVLIFSSLTVALAVDAAQRGDRSRTLKFLAVTLACAFGFLVIKAIEYTDKFGHYTIVATDKAGGPTYVYDGHVHEHDGKRELHGYRMELGDAPFDVYRISEHQVRGEAKEAQTFDLTGAVINTEVNYGPWRNIFFSCYYALTGVHGVHVIGGIIAIGILLVQTGRGKLYPAHVEYTGLYWHFVDLVWIFLFPLLYLI